MSTFSGPRSAQSREFNLFPYALFHHKHHLVQASSARLSPLHFPEGKYTLNYKLNPRFANHPGTVNGGILQMYISHTNRGGSPDHLYRVMVLENSTDIDFSGKIALYRIGEQYIVPQQNLMYLFIHYGLDTEEAWEQVFQGPPHHLKGRYLPLLMSIIGATKAHPKPAHKENPYDSDFGKILKPYEKYKIPGNAHGIRFNTRFGVRKLLRSQKGLYIKANNKKFYLHRY